MFDGIENDRLLAMSDQERRWFDNIKKAFGDADEAILSGKPQDRCMEELCKAVDTAKTLRRSLRGDGVTKDSNKKLFTDFLYLEIPRPAEEGKGRVKLIDARSGKPVEYSIVELVYAIRCMIHENENLNAAERPDYHVQLDWNTQGPYFGVLENGRLLLNARFIVNRLREVLAKFITGLDGMMAFAEGRDFAIGIRPPMGSIRHGVTLKKL